MKNIIVYAHPSKCFNAAHLKEAQIQIDNSLDLGWKKEDIWFITNFDFEYHGVKSMIVGDDVFYPASPTVSKINGALKLFETGFIKGLCWLHDLDAYQVSPFTEDILDGYDMGVCNYGRVPMWATGTMFFTNKAQDLFQAIQNYCYNTPARHGITEQKALRHLVGNSINPNETGHPMAGRVKLLNISYNFTHINLRSNYATAIKPLKVVHFHYTPEWIDFWMSKDLLPERFKKFFL